MSDQDSRPSSDEIVEQWWPYDGPHSAEKVESAAQVMSGLTRYMNNATWNAKLLPGPSLYRVLSGLNGVMWGLDQLTEHLGRTVDQLAVDPTMYDDRRDDDHPASQTAADIGAVLAEVRRRLVPARQHVERAAHLACHLGHELSGRMPKDERNGIGAISAALQDDPEATHAVLLLVNCSQITTDVDTGDIIPTARIVAVEAFPGHTADAKGIARMVNRKFEQRTGMKSLPLKELGLGDDAAADGAS